MAPGRALLRAVAEFDKSSAQRFHAVQVVVGVYQVNTLFVVPGKSLRAREAHRVCVRIRQGDVAPIVLGGRPEGVLLGLITGIVRTPWPCDGSGESGYQNMIIS